jgi:hypothetical protein
MVAFIMPAAGGWLAKKCVACSSNRIHTFLIKQTKSKLPWCLGALAAVIVMHGYILSCYDDMLSWLLLLLLLMTSFTSLLRCVRTHN